MKQKPITTRDMIGAQSDLLERFDDDDIEVTIIDSTCIGIKSTKLPTLDFVVRLIEFEEGSLERTKYSIGTSHIAPAEIIPNANGESLCERVLQWKETQELAKRKELAAKSGKTKLGS